MQQHTKLSFRKNKIAIFKSAIESLLKKNSIECAYNMLMHAGPVSNSIRFGSFDRINNAADQLYRFLLFYREIKKNSSSKFLNIANFGIFRLTRNLNCLILLKTPGKLSLTV